MVNFPTVTCNLAFQRPPFRRPRSKKERQANKCKHLAESLSLSLFLLSTTKRSVCRTGPRADVNTAPNYKSHSKRAMLWCPVAPSTKAQCWEHMRQLLQTHNRGRRTSVVMGVRGMLGASARSFLLSETLVVISGLLSGVHFLPNRYKREHAPYF